MTVIKFRFSDYPAFVDGAPAILDGIAEIEACMPLKLPRFDERPLQGALGWRIKRVTISGDRAADAADVERFVIGRYWSRIPALLYSAFLRNQAAELRSAASRADGYATLSGLQPVNADSEAGHDR